MKRAAVLLIFAIPLVFLAACATKPAAPVAPVEKPLEQASGKPLEAPVEEPREVAPTRPVDRPFDAPVPHPVESALAKPEAPVPPARPAGIPVAGVASRPVAKPLAKPQEKPAPPTPVADADVQKARDALARAKAADAAYYESDLYRAAGQDLDAGLQARTAEPDRSRAYLASTVDKANRAYAGSVRKAATELDARWKAMDARLRGADADKFAVPDYRATVTQWSKVTSQYASATGDVSAARAEAYAALKTQSDLYDRLADRLRSVDLLKTDVGRYLSDMEQVEADRWAPQELAETNRLYFLGVEAFQSYGLDETEEYYGAAREAAKHAIAVARQNRAQTEEAKRAEADRLMRDVMKELEAASKMTVVTDDGKVIMPKEWSGEDILRGIENLDTAAPASGKQSLLIPADGSVVVLGDATDSNLLDQAKELWAKGLAESANKSYETAMEYFNESRKYVAAYRAQAVKAVYTVRLLPDRRDCLWRIAEYDFVYGNAYLWPKIWRRNRKLIQNPDLVYPGWLLVIPPAE
jgi:nucleoid-associated protein YgaU